MFFTCQITDVYFDYQGKYHLCENTLIQKSYIVFIPKCFTHVRLLMCIWIIKNKSAQRALGRSPEEKVKGHSGANSREPQGHNLNNFGKGPFDDVIY